jgi:hypothetical protein
MSINEFTTRTDCSNVVQLTVIISMALSGNTFRWMGVSSYTLEGCSTGRMVVFVAGMASNPVRIAKCHEALKMVLLTLSVTEILSHPEKARFAMKLSWIRDCIHNANPPLPNPL